MKPKNTSLLSVSIPPDIRETLDAMADARGESLSLVVRDLLRQAFGDTRARDLGVPKFIAGGVAPSAKADLR
jgi:metal-responsive CopG/Arc/MetJ family transcriptional regulator